MKKFLMVVMTGIISISMIACGSGSDSGNKESNTSQEVASDNNKEQEKKTGDDSVGKVDETEIGKRVTVKSNKQIGQIQQSGPFTIKISAAQISTLEPKSNYKDTFGGKDKVTVVTLEVEVENKSGDTNVIYPDQGLITTNTKEQVEADIFLSENLGGEYIGEVVKKGNVIFLLDSKAEDVQSINYMLTHGQDSEYNFFDGKSYDDKISFNIEF